MTTNAGGYYEVDVDLYGKLEKVYLYKYGLDTPDLLIKDATTDETLFSATAVAASTRWYPKVLNVSNTNAALTVTANIYSKQFVGRARVSVSGAGAANSGTVYLWISHRD